MRYEQLQALLTHQTALISRIALEADLKLCLQDIAIHIEALVDEHIKTAIFIIENEELRQLAAPSLPELFHSKVDRIPIAHDSMPCAIAAQTGETIIIEDLQNTFYCQNFAHLSLTLNLKACWATPIFSAQKEVQGVFIVYFPEIQRPNESHLEILEHFTHLTSIALEKHNLRTQQQKAQTQIEQLAFYDALTNLPNRRLLMDRTQKVIDRIKREHLFGALIFIDLNGFKRINDSLGHYVGDKLLVSVARRLQNSIREVDTIARIGGDEFVILLEDLSSSRKQVEQEALQVAQRSLKDLEKHFELSDRRYRIDASIGIAVINEFDCDAIEVLKHADAAMYEAKKTPHKKICFHNDVLQESIDHRLRVEGEINDALEHFAFHAHYQPQVDLNGKLIAAEALIRWHHPERGLIYPNDFIPVAERMGAMDKMQEAMLTEACETLCQLKRLDLLKDNFRISVNICASQLKSNTLPMNLIRTLEHYELSPGYFMLEITEGMLIEDLEQTVSILDELRQKGFKISIDDFGTGYSSLSYLNSLPVNEIKIDKSFISTLSDEPSTHGVIDTVIALSKHFHFEVIAEGIEQPTQLEVLRKKDVKGVQGYLFAKPMNQSDFINWVKAA